MSSQSLILSDYHVGGSLLPQDSTYVKRDADQELYTAIKAGEFCYVFNSRQMGKSSVRVQVMQRLQEEGVACAAIDLSSIGSSQEVTPKKWYAAVIRNLIISFNLGDYINLRNWLKERESFTLVELLGSFIETILLKEIGSPIVIFFDEIDSILSLYDFSRDDFLAFIRFCYNIRTDKSDYSRLSFVLIGVANPSDLMQDKTRTPFNIGRAIDLTGFSLEQVKQPLGKGLVGKVDCPEAVLAEILTWTGGQPFLTQKLCQMVANLESKIVKGAEKERIAELVRDRVIYKWESQDIPEHLKTIRDRVCRDNPERPNPRKAQVLSLYQQVLEEGAVDATESLAEIDLRLSGLVVKQNNQIRSRNRIYADIFDLNWVKTELDNLRPYGDSLQLWITQNRHDDSCLLRGQELQQALIWAEDKSLSDLDYHFLAASQEVAQKQAETELKAEQLARTQEKAASLKRFLQLSLVAIALLTIFSFLAITFGIKAQIERKKAEISEIKAINAHTTALMISNDDFDALILSLRAFGKQKQIEHSLIGHWLSQQPQNQELRKQISQTLQETVYRVQERDRLEGNTGKLFSISFSPDGNILAIADENGIFRLWNLQTQQIQTIKAHNNEIRNITFSPNGKLIATASWDKTAKIWDNKGKLILNFNDHHDKLHSITFHPQGNIIATGCEDGTVILWNLQGQVIRTLKGHQQAVLDLSFSPDGQLLATASFDNTAKLWNLAGKQLQTFLGHENHVFSITFSPDGKTLVTGGGSLDPSIRLWNLQGQQLHKLTGHRDTVTSLRFSPNGDTLISGSADHTAKIWGWDGQYLQTLTGHQGIIRSVRFSPDGQTIATASEDHSVKLWHLNPHDILSTQALDLAWSPHGKSIATANGRNVVRLWHTKPTSYSMSLIGHHNEASAVSFSPNQSTIATAGYDGNIILWNLDNGKPLTKLIDPQDPNEIITDLTFSPDGNSIITTSEDKNIKLWTTEGKLGKILTSHQEEVQSVNFSPDGTKFVTASWDQTAIIWGADGQLLKILQGHQGKKPNDWMMDAHFSPNGSILATLNRDGTVKLWTLDGTNFHTFQVSNQPTRDLEFSPDNQMLAVSGGDSISFWNLNGQNLRNLTGDGSHLLKIKFSPDGQQLLSSDVGGRIRLWNLNWNVDDLWRQGCNWVSSYGQHHQGQAIDDVNGFCQDSQDMVTVK